LLRRALAVAKHLHRETVGARLPLMAASAAFFGFFALFPLLLGVVSLYGLVASASEIRSGVEQLAYAMPPEAKAVLVDQFDDIAARSDTELCISLLVGVGVAIFSSAKATFALIWGINAAYGRTETRPYVTQRLLAIGLTAGALLFVVCALALIAVLPIALPKLGLDYVWRLVVSVGRWPLLALAHATALSILFHYAPNRARRKYKWFSWGALSAAVVWLAASALMSWYAAHFPESNEIYGALGGVIALNLWLYVSILTVLLGAKLNAEIERRVDSTVEQPLQSHGHGLAL
jgi:membrane protein